MGQAPAGGGRRTKPVNLGAVPRLTARQRRFVAEYLRSRNTTAAAVAAGYSARSARSIAAQLLDGRTYPLVAAEVGRQLDTLLRHVHTALLFCPADYCSPGDEGWRAAAEYRAWPPEVKALVEGVERRPDGPLRVRFVSKTAMIALAAKYQLGGRTNIVVHQIDWEGMVRGARTPEPDPTEERLRAIAALPDPAADGLADRGSDDLPDQAGHPPRPGHDVVVPGGPQVNDTAQLETSVF